MFGPSSLINSLAENESVWIVRPDETVSDPLGFGYSFRCFKCGTDNPANISTPFCPICGREMNHEDVFDTQLILGGPSSYFEDKRCACDT